MLLREMGWPAVAWPQVTVPVPEAKATASAGSDQPDPDGWFDRLHEGVYRLVWRSARSLDSLSGAQATADEYREASGSIGLGVLWDEFDGYDLKVRFNVDLPLPRINKRLHLFIGRVNRDEFVTERDAYSGAFPDERPGESEEDQTLAGLIYSREASNNVTFSGSIGGRIKSGALDPYVKTSLRYRRVIWGDTLFTAKETLFYQMSEKFGLTTRLELERMFGELWRVRWTGSATVSEETEGVRSFSHLTATRSFSDRRAIVFRAGIEGDTSLEVPLEEFGVKVAYRQSVVRDWFVLEVRTSLTWPKELRTESRKPSWGFGLGCEMYFGTDEFSSRPVTF